MNNFITSYWNKSYCHIGLLFFILFAIFAEQAKAEVSQRVVNKMDINKDGLINPGQETELLREFYNQMSPYQRAQWQVAGLLDDPKKGVPIENFSSEGWYRRLETACTPGQRFFLRDRVVNTSLLQPGLTKVAGDQASISATRNNQSDSWSWNLQGAVTAVPYWNPCLADEDWKANELVLSGAAFAPFLEFDGSGNNGLHGNSKLRAGLNIELQLFSGAVFDLQQINILPYYQTDFSFDGEIYGLNAVWYPVSIEHHLGGYVGLPGRLEYWWTIQAEADFLTVINPGRTGLAQDTNYGWLSAQIGGHLEFNPGEGAPVLFADASYTFREDVVNSISANMTEATVGLYLNESENTSLILKYEQGINYQTLTQIDQYTVRLGVKF